MAKENQPELKQVLETVRIVERGRPIAFSDDLVLLVDNYANGRLRVSLDATPGCGKALARQRQAEGKSRRGLAATRGR
jgi:hypothetical protein